MNDYIEIDFLAVGDGSSGDAITLRYSSNNKEYIHVVDGGFVDTGNDILMHIDKYYGENALIDRVIVTHQDSDHTKGLRTVLGSGRIKELWMLRPWVYAEELIDSFSRWSNTDNLIKHLKEVYSNIRDLEEIALEKEIPIKDPLQGERIGEFLVLAPSKKRYLELLIESEKTPNKYKDLTASLESNTKMILNRIKFWRWGEENLSNEPTSAENNMSIVQYADIDSKTILLTGDAGVETLDEAINYYEQMYNCSIELNAFQVPHHGSRRNISSEILDNLFGNKIQENETGNKFSAIVSAGKNDEHHPKKATIRALYHRGGNVVATQGKTICSSSRNSPQRDGWSSATSLDYPTEQEE